MSQSLVLGDLAGFAALGFAGTSAALMVFRARIVKAFGAEKVRDLHVAVSLLAAAFLAAHVLLLFSPPVTMALDLGYAGFALGVILWMTGVGFLERNRDSFFFHGSLALAVIALVVVHAASSSTSLPPDASVPALFAAGGVAFASASYNIRKMRPKPK